MQSILHRLGLASAPAPSVRTPNLPQRCEVYIRTPGLPLRRVAVLDAEHLDRMASADYARQAQGMLAAEAFVPHGVEFAPPPPVRVAPQHSHFRMPFRAQATPPRRSIFGSIRAGVAAVGAGIATGFSHTMAGLRHAWNCTRQGHVHMADFASQWAADRNESREGRRQRVAFTIAAVSVWGAVASCVTMPPLVIPNAVAAIYFAYLSEATAQGVFHNEGF